MTLPRLEDDWTPPRHITTPHPAWHELGLPRRHAPRDFEASIRVIRDAFGCETDQADFRWRVAMIEAGLEQRYERVQTSIYLDRGVYMYRFTEAGQRYSAWGFDTAADAVAAMNARIVAARIAF